MTDSNIEVILKIYSDILNSGDNIPEELKDNAYKCASAILAENPSLENNLPKYDVDRSDFNVIYNNGFKDDAEDIVAYNNMPPELQYAIDNL